MIGAQAGRYIAFDSTGIDFSMTALFIVIMAVLVVYCFRNIDFQSTSHFLPALLAGALVADCISGRKISCSASGWERFVI